MIRATALAASLLLAAVPATAQSTEAGCSAAALGDADLVLLRTGEVIEGRPTLVTARGLPDAVLINGERLPYYHVRTFRLDGRVFGFAPGADTGPILVVKFDSGHASLFRDPSHETDGTEFFQLGDGPIYMATPRHIREVLGAQPAVMARLQRDRLLHYVGAGSMAIGAGLIATGAVFEFTELDGPNGIYLALGGVGFAALVNAIIAPLRLHQRRAAVRAYRP